MSAPRTDRGVSQMLDVVGVPLYRQIQSDLRERINNGQPPPGSRLETEQELMARYEVSRATVRQALAGLVNDGLVEIRRGLGTYVRKPAVEHRLGGFYSYSREIERHGMRPGTRVRSLQVEEAGQRVATVLEIEPGDPVVALSRVRLADDEAIVTETSYLPADRFVGLEDLEFSRRGLYETLTSVFGVRPVRARETFEPVLMTRSEAAELGGTAGSPALRVERTTYDVEGHVIEYCRSTLRADRYHYSVELGDV
jgi:GntR family transcriptional regulator